MYGFPRDQPRNGTRPGVRPYAFGRACCTWLTRTLVIGSQIVTDNAPRRVQRFLLFRWVLGMLLVSTTRPEPADGDQGQVDIADGTPVGNHERAGGNRVP